MRGRRPRLHPLHRVMRSFDFRLRAGPPLGPNNRGRLLERPQRFGIRPNRPTHGPDGRPESPRPQRQLEPPPTQQIQCGGLLPKHRGPPQRQTGHIRKHPQPLGLRQHGSDHRKRIRQPASIRMILYPKQIQPLPIRHLRHPRQPRQLTHRRRPLNPESQVHKVILPGAPDTVAHRNMLPRNQQGVPSDRLIRRSDNASTSAEWIRSIGPYGQPERGIARGVSAE